MPVRRLSVAQFAVPVFGHRVLYPVELLRGTIRSLLQGGSPREPDFIRLAPTDGISAAVLAPVLAMLDQERAARAPEKPLYAETCDISLLRASGFDDFR